MKPAKQLLLVVTALILFAASFAVLGLITKKSSGSLLKFIKTVKVAPDDFYLSGGFTRIYYVPANDNFVVTFGGKIAKSAGKCPVGKAYSYKEYTLDMREAGKSGTFACDPADAGSVMVGNDYYYAAMTRQDENVGWHLMKIDVTDWSTLADKNFYIDHPREGDADPMVVFANDKLQISSAYSDAGKPPGPDTPKGTFGSFHYFFDSDFNKTDKKILTDAKHINGMYMTYADGIYYLVSADLYDGDIVLMEYDKDWKFISSKTLIKQANWSTGLIYDGKYFYMSYEDTSQRNGAAYFPVYENVRLAVFDDDWNLLQDLAVTDFTRADNMQTGRPWVIKHDDKIYVSYDVDTRDPVTHEEDLIGQAYVSVYELSE